VIDAFLYGKSAGFGGPLTSTPQGVVSRERETNA
jgi:hypothetical protein